MSKALSGTLLLDEYVLRRNVISVGARMMPSYSFHFNSRNDVIMIASRESVLTDVILLLADRKLAVIERHVTWRWMGGARSGVHHGSIRAICPVWRGVIPASETEVSRCY